MSVKMESGFQARAADGVPKSRGFWPVAGNVETKIAGGAARGQLPGDIHQEQWPFDWIETAREQNSFDGTFASGNRDLEAIEVHAIADDPHPFRRIPGGQQMVADYIGNGNPKIQVLRNAGSRCDLIPFACGCMNQIDQLDLRKPLPEQ